MTVLRLQANGLDAAVEACSCLAELRSLGALATTTRSGSACLWGGEPFVCPQGSKVASAGATNGAALQLHRQTTDPAVAPSAGRERSGRSQGDPGEEPIAYPSTTRRC